MDKPLDADTSPADDDAFLLQLYARGDAGAARHLTQRYLPRVFRHAYRMLGDSAEAEDVAQEAMMRLWRVAPDWRVGEAQVNTWLYRVTANLCIDRLRQRRPVDIDDAVEAEDDAPTVLDQIQVRSRVKALQQALTTLPTRQRQAVVLRHMDGLSNTEIAAIMEISPRAVESLTARGKRSLSALLSGRRSELGFEDDAG
jgi:RNA polymerase sigma-70 factor (ECF subfamily)